jgi:hypothetical protein
MEEFLLSGNYGIPRDHNGKLLNLADMLENLTDEEISTKEACYELISSMKYVEDDESPNGARPPRGNILPVNRFFSDWYPFVGNLSGDLEVPKAREQTMLANPPGRNYEKLLKLLERIKRLSTDHNLITTWEEMDSAFNEYEICYMLQSVYMAYQYIDEVPRVRENFKDLKKQTKAVPLEHFESIYEECQEFCKKINYFKQNGKNVDTMMDLTISMKIHTKETLYVRQKLEEHVNNPKLEFPNELEGREKAIWESIHNDFLAHQSAEFTVLVGKMPNRKNHHNLCRDRKSKAV